MPITRGTLPIGGGDTAIGAGVRVGMGVGICDIDCQAGVRGEEVVEADPLPVKSGARIGESGSPRAAAPGRCESDGACVTSGGPASRCFAFIGCGQSADKGSDSNICCSRYIRAFSEDTPGLLLSSYGRDTVTGLKST